MKDKINALERELEKGKTDVEDMTMNAAKQKEIKESTQSMQIICKFYNGGYCKDRSWCDYEDPKKVVKSSLRMKTVMWEYHLWSMYVEKIYV